MHPSLHGQHLCIATLFKQVWQLQIASGISAAKRRRLRNIFKLAASWCSLLWSPDGYRWLRRRFLLESGRQLVGDLSFKPSSKHRVTIQQEQLTMITLVRILAGPDSQEESQEEDVGRLCSVKFLSSQGWSWSFVACLRLGN